MNYIAEFDRIKAALMEGAARRKKTLETHTPPGIHHADAAEIIAEIVNKTQIDFKEIDE